MNYNVWLCKIYIQEKITYGLLKLIKILNRYKDRNLAYDLHEIALWYNPTEELCETIKSYTSNRNTE